MDYRTLGRTGIRVSAVSFGAGPISGLMTGEDEAGQRATLRRAVERGINWFDTAAIYGDGRSEEALGRALADLPPGASFHVATKVRFGDDDVADFAGAARRSLEGSLRRLGLSRVTLLQLHNSITPGRGDLHTSLTPADVLGPRGVLAAFDALRRDGLVAHLGLTGLGDARSLALVVREGDFATVQAAFNVLNPSAGRRMPAGFAESDLEDLFGQCHERDMGVFAIRVFAGGALAGQPPSPHTHKTKFFPLDLYQRDQRRADYLRRILPDLLSPRELALRFVLDHPHVTSALVGMADAMQVDEAVRHAAAGALPSELLSAVELAATHGMLETAPGFNNSGPSMSQTNSDPAAPAALTATGRYVVLSTAFLGWMFAGTLMAVTPLTSRSAALDMLPASVDAQRNAAADEATGKKVIETWVSEWFARLNASFLFGAAAGGLLFGWAGDKLGRARAMGMSILCFTLLSGVSYFVTSIEQLMVLRFLACMGVGGMWPNGIAIVSEAWSDVSRPILAGLIGTAANVGLVLIGLLACYVKITPDSWRWVMLLVASPCVLGVFVLLAVPESPKWLAGGEGRAKAASPVAEVFRPPLLAITLVGIGLGTIPLLGGWGSGNWLVPWADSVGGSVDPFLKSWTQVSRSLGGAISSLLGGMVAGYFGRKRSYFLISLGALLTSAYIFGGLGFEGLEPAKPGEYGAFDFLGGLVGAGPAVSWDSINWFSFWSFMVGIIGGFYFGWLPLCLPELFPTRVRSTGAGITFNFGRVASAFGVLGAGVLSSHFQGDYARVGAVTSLVYGLGMIIIWFAPNTDGKIRDD